MTAEMTNTSIVVTKGVFNRKPKSNTIIESKCHPVEEEKLINNQKVRTMPNVITTPKHSGEDNLRRDFLNHPYKHLVSDIHDVSAKTFKNFLTLTYKGLYYCKYNLKSPPQSLITSKKVKLGPLPSLIF